jgi:serine protease
MKKHFALGLVAAVCLMLLATGSLFAETLHTKSMARLATQYGEIEYVRGEVLVAFTRGVSSEQMAELNRDFGSSVMSVHGGNVRKLRVPAGVTEEDFVARLQRDPRIKAASLNSICHAFMIPNDPLYDPYQWHFPKIGCPAAWDISTGTDIIVGILDSGIAYEDYPIPSYELDTVQSGVTTYVQAPDLAGTAFVPGYDYINNDTHPNDNCSHGTHVAGTMAQTTNNSLGVAGMAFDCKLMPVKVLDYSGTGTAQTLIDGLEFAADNGAQVINMSLGWVPGYDPGPLVHAAIQYAYNAGCVLVAGSGNAGVGIVSYPAAYSEVIAVGATRYDDELADYSQYGTAQELTAPGGDIYVDQNGDGYGDGVLQQTFAGYDPGPPEVLADPTDIGYWFFDGTSMASPHVTALVAMMIANGQTGIENIRTILQESAVDLGSPGWDQYYGYGRIDAYAALTYSPEINADFVGDPTSGLIPLEVTFTDQSTGEVDTWEWDFGDGSPHSFVHNPVHTYESEDYYTVSLTVTGPAGSDTETKVDYIHAYSGGAVKDYADQDIPVAGTVTGDYLDTYDSDDVYESILERDSGGKPSSRYSYLEHKWTIDVTGGTSVAFYVEAHQTASSDGDNFVFAYSTNDVTYTDLVTVTSTSDQFYSAPMPSTTAGAVYIRVRDTDRTSGNRYMDEIFIDQMYIESAMIPDEIPPTVSLLVPNGGESWQAGTVQTIVWNASDNVGITSTEIDYTYDGGGTWYDVANLSGNPGSYDWEVPNTPSTECLVMVTCFDAAANYGLDESDGFFTILEMVEKPMYVNSIAMEAVQTGANDYARATPEIVDDATGLGIQGVVVNGHWYGASSDADQCTTGPDGKCTVQSDIAKKATQDFCFMVDGLDKTGYYWDDTKGVTTNCIAPLARDREPLLAAAPSTFSVSRNHPNPFNDVTRFTLRLPVATEVSFVVYNMMGQRVKTLVSHNVDAGSYTVTWDGTNDTGQAVSSGIYFYRVVAGDNTVTHKMMLAR